MYTHGGVYLIDVHLTHTGVRLAHKRAPRPPHHRLYESHRRVPYGRASHGRVPHGHAPHRRVPHGSTPHGRTPHRRVPHWRVLHGSVPHGRATQQKQDQGKVGLIILKTDKESPITNTASEQHDLNDNVTYLFKPPALSAPPNRAYSHEE